VDGAQTGPDRPTDDASPPLRAVLGFLARHRAFRVRSWRFAGRFDNGVEAEIPGWRVDRDGGTDDDMVVLADVEGDLMLFRPTGCQTLCTCGAAASEGLSAFRRAVPASWFLVI
jgi:hypothetical protein